ncbi:ABC transporter permease [Geminicoccus flavidas]|uniref:ABC transporter permease n=1 Tax=Geminicoccus flavidas TaxID=2506407 RepID=UPI00135B6703|nr:ABC transporter permease [Geminicoccus flavidas]
MRGERGKQVLITAVVLFDLLFLALPTVIILLASFTSGSIVRFPPEGFSLRWYVQLVSGGAFLDAFGRSLLVATLATLFAVPAGTLAALALARWRFRTAGLIRLWLLLPFTIPLVVAGLGMMALFGEWRILGSLWPVGLACCIINLPFMLWAVSAAVNHLDPELENAAANLGAAPLHRFVTVTIPAVMPGIVTGGLLMFILAFNEFLVSLMLTDARTVTLPVQIYTSIRAVITPDLAAVSAVYVLVALLAVWLLDRLVGLDLFLRAR